MRERVRPRLTYANVMSSVAAFIALGGGAVWAAAQIGADDIKRKAVRAKHIKPDAVRTKHLAHGTPTDVVIVEDNSNVTSTDKNHGVECPGGRLPIGGGAALQSGGTGFVALSSSRPQFRADGDDVDGWLARGIEVNGGTNQTWDVVVWATCARGVTPPD